MHGPETGTRTMEHARRGIKERPKLDVQITSGHSVESKLESFGERTEFRRPLIYAFTIYLSNAQTLWRSGIKPGARLVMQKHGIQLREQIH
jgi:hypothetical protein